jgi:hypothetical protein
LTFAYNSSIIILEKELRNMNKLIDKIVETAIKKYGFEDPKTVTIAENAENLKEKISNNLVKVY